MRFKNLWIDGFKNLNNFELDFTDKSYFLELSEIIILFTKFYFCNIV